MNQHASRLAAGFLLFGTISQGLLAQPTTAPAMQEPGKIGSCASLYATNRDGPVNNVEVMWAATGHYDKFEVGRSNSESGPFTTVYSGNGMSYCDQGLKEGTYFYQVSAVSGNDKLVSHVSRVTTLKPMSGLSVFSNQVANENGLPGEPLKVGDTYYRFNIIRDQKGFNRMMMSTSTDQKNWSEEKVVMDKSSSPDFDDCKFESEHTFYDKKNDQFVFWGHWERSNGYRDGKAAIATAKPGQPFTVKHVYNPLDVQVRDMSQFIDDDGTGYLVAAANLKGQGANATLYIFKLNSTYDDVVEITARVIENGYREAPHIARKDGIYYLVFSQAAGWYPSQGGYVSAKSLSGPWTGPRKIGNSSTFAAQSGGLMHFGAGENKIPVMMANRWLRGEGTSRNSAMPIFFDNGFAFYDWSPELMYDYSKNILIPVQMGQLLSQGKPAEASIAGKPEHEAAAAFDGSYDTSFTSDTKKWPFWISTDLGSVCEVKNVQISWLIAKGSEGFYTYTIEGSTDGKEWKMLVDRSNKEDKVISKTYGFSSEVLPEETKAKFIRINVLNAHLHNNPNNNWYNPTVYEVKIFGTPGTK